MGFIVNVGVNEDGFFDNLRKANLSVWDAVGELIDNSISAINKRWTDGKGGKIQITYYLDNEKPTLKISDNGIGIDEHVLKNKMFQLYDRPDDRNGLNEFGIGMKHGLATIGERYRIESWPIGASNKFTVPFFAFNEVKEGLNVDVSHSEHDTCGTTVTILLRRQWNEEEWNLLLDHLSYAYRTFLRGFNATPLSARETIVVETSYTRKNGDLIERNLQAPELKMLREHPAGADQKCELDQPIKDWREDFQIQLTLSEESGVVHKISGWIGILEKGDTLRKVGIAIVRRGRALEVTGSYGWLPSNIVGRGNDFGVQRVVGELYWDSMPAQQTKTIPPDSKFLGELAGALINQYWANSKVRIQNKNFRKANSCINSRPQVVPTPRPPEVLKEITPTATIMFNSDPFRGIEFTLQFIEDVTANPIHRSVSRYNRQTKTFLVQLRPRDIATYKAADESLRKALVASWSVTALIMSGSVEIDRFEEYIKMCEVFEAEKI